MLAPPSQFAADPRSWQGATEIAPYGWNAGKTKRAPVSRGPRHFRGGDDGIRTHDPHVANVMLSQLSYIPTKVCAFAQGSILPDFETIVNRFA